MPPPTVLYRFDRTATKSRIRGYSTTRVGCRSRWDPTLDVAVYHDKVEVCARYVLADATDDPDLAADLADAFHRDVFAETPDGIPLVVPTTDVLLWVVRHLRPKDPTL